MSEEKNTFEQFLTSHTNAKNKEMTDLENTFDTMKKIIFLKRIIKICKIFLDNPNRGHEVIKKSD